MKNLGQTLFISAFVGALLVAGALTVKTDETEQDFPVVVRATYEPHGGGDLPDIEETFVRLRNAPTLVDQTLRNPLRRPEGIEVCPFVERGIALRVEDDEYDTDNLRECELAWHTERFFDLEHARLVERAHQLAEAGE